MELFVAFELFLFRKKWTDELWLKFLPPKRLRVKKFQRIEDDHSEMFHPSKVVFTWDYRTNASNLYLSISLR
jgi:hypothetical protein